MFEITDEIREEYDKYVNNFSNEELEPIIDNWIEKLQEMGFGSDTKIYYSVGFSQGDFTYITGYLNVPQFIKYHKMGNYFKLWLTRYNNDWCRGDAFIKYYGRNSYYTTFEIDCYNGCPWNNDDQENKFISQMNNIEGFIDEKINDYNFEIFYELSNHLLYLMSDEAIEEWYRSR